jgi:hypothetical protein
MIEPFEERLERIEGHLIDIKEMLNRVGVIGSLFSRLGIGFAIISIGIGMFGAAMALGELVTGPGRLDTLVVLLVVISPCVIGVGLGVTIWSALRIERHL